MLNTLVHGAPTDAPPLVIVHGLYGSARNFNVIAKRLSDTRQVIAVDQRNHGESPRFDTHTYPEMADDIAEVIEAHGGHADLLGHSMGGKAAMQLALTRGDLIRRLIIADIAPVAYNHSQRHLVHAMRGLDLTSVTTRGEANERLAALIEDERVRAFLLQSLDLKADPPRWRLNLDVLDACMDEITGWPGTEGVFQGSALFLSGELSDYVLPEHRATIRALFPQARFAKLPDTGHWLHAEKPRDFEATVDMFLSA
ncbi:alpha/beta hydrolase [Pacificitalea manganoxidans]|uniref:Alpha/beta hydrolase n=1 Tax=Pacificitalea manganoxidans TaxID=1411902 RepID=A0A291M2G7_9RHOB|nr:alpha/beta fold hydrolase [Pacificitalea manganoxidans]ATI43100.1 alpha/beta hydrolase [Pacificitalea manganoxidans]MDR6306963.1 pimeloyl-ACP methyl ester carboxylesterase [Pacificitalea manganoxidans]